MILRTLLLSCVFAIACVPVSAQSRIFYDGDEVAQPTGHVDIPELSRPGSSLFSGANKTLLSSTPGAMGGFQSHLPTSHVDIPETRVTVSQVRDLATTWGAQRYTLVGRGEIVVTSGHLIRLDSELFTEAGLASPGQSILEGVWMNPTDSAVFLEVDGVVMELAPDTVFGVVEQASMCVGCEITCRDGWKACCNYGSNGSPASCDCVRINGGQNSCDVGGGDGAVSCGIECPNTSRGGGGGDSQPLLPEAPTPDK